MDYSSYYYCLGFLWADGHVAKSNSCYIDFLYEDSIIIKSLFEKNFNISFRIRERKNRKKQISIYVKTGNFDFHKYNFKNKSLVNNKLFYDIPDLYKPNFLLGFFDGDGCVYFYPKRSLCQITFSGSYNQDWLWLEDYLKIKEIKYSLKRVTTKKNHKYSFIRVTNKQNIIKFKDIFYYNNNLGLPRKKEKYYQILNFYKV